MGGRHLVTEHDAHRLTGGPDGVDGCLRETSRRADERPISWAGLRPSHEGDFNERHTHSALSTVEEHRTEVAEVHRDGRRPGRGEHGVGHAAGEDDPAGLDGVTTTGQVVRGERERLAGMALDGGTRWPSRR
jgi:hypothetical protein